MMNRSHICLLSCSAQNELFILSVICFMLNVQHRYQFCVFTGFFVLLFARLMKIQKSKKLLAWLNLFLSICKWGKLRKAFREFIIWFHSVWWFLDEDCNIWQLLIFVKRMKRDGEYFGMNFWWATLKFSDDEILKIYVVWCNFLKT